MPSVKNIAAIKTNLLRPSLTSHYEVTIGLPSGFDKVMNEAFGYSQKPHQEQLHLLCSEATLPGSSLATTEINNNLTSLGSKLEPNRVATAAQFLGHSVLIPGQVASPDDNGEIHGVVDLPLFSNDVGLTFANSNGEIVHSMSLGSHDKGLVGFSWTDIPEEIKKNKTQLTIQAYSGNAEGSDGLNTAVYNKVIAASAPKNSEDVILETKDYGEISAAEAIKFKSNK